MSWKESDPLSLWKASTTVPKPVDIQNFEKSNIVERFVGSRSKIWESLSEIPLHSRSLYLNKLFDVWPYWRERFAFEV
jgi:hypothetical protein